MTQQAPPSSPSSEGPSSTYAAPSINLPKGGGAIRGIGEKFAANPVTGTGSMSVPIATSPGRAGFGPQLSLSYDSGAGNGPFGLGWHLSLPSITRKTDKGIPQYLDEVGSDVFLLSGAEDLVPEYEKDAAGGWLTNDGQHVQRKQLRTVDGQQYLVRSYRPRIEGLFARIERWTRQSDGDTHWRSLTRDNLLNLYGLDSNSRIADPEDPQRVYSWLICETRDDRGNGLVYEYKSENDAQLDLGQAHEANRSSLQRQANRYHKRILYGNRKSLLDASGQRPAFLTSAQRQDATWMFELVFDYGEHDGDNPLPSAAHDWPQRLDPFSTYRPGFEVRTYRCCQRVLMFHHFPDEPDVGLNCLVNSTDLRYTLYDDPQRPNYTYLRAVTHTGYKRQSGGGYLKKNLPPVEFEYTIPDVQHSLDEVEPHSLVNLPTGVDGREYQWADLHGEGIPGILSEQASAWFYQRNVSPISTQPVEFAPLERVASKPLATLAGGAQLMDLAGDGQPDVVVMDGPVTGLYEHDLQEGWEPFQPFLQRLNRDIRDPNLKFVDLTGDGHPDVLITETDELIWHPSLEEAGYGPAHRVAMALDERRGPRVVFADGTQSVSLADMSGDGLTDLVRVRNGEVCYWPNLGYGRFGAKVSMDHAPQLDFPELFDQRRIRLADIDGSGTTDLIYLQQDGVRLYFNQSGNRWSDPQLLNVFPMVDDLVDIAAADLLGNGTACLVWSSGRPGTQGRTLRYVNLMGETKPHLLTTSRNNLGAETHVYYAPSTRFYLLDKYAGKPWISKLPFPVHVVERVETYDRVSRNRFVSRYAYHHGHFDGLEREFRGFAMVEQWDTEEISEIPDAAINSAATNLDSASYQPPIHTKTWFHTGIYLGRGAVSNFFAGLVNDADLGEYYREPGWTDTEMAQNTLPDTVLPAGLTLEEEREACRALKGATLRQEVYADDQTAKSGTPYSVTEQNFTVQCLQPRGENQHAVFFTHAREALTFHYERNPSDPRIQHALTLDVDEFGDVLRSLTVGYGRRQADPALTAEDQKKQSQLRVTYTLASFTNAISLADQHRTPLPSEVKTFEITGLVPSAGATRFAYDDLIANQFGSLDGLPERPYDQPATPATPAKRLIEQVRSQYRRNNLAGLLPQGELESLALPGEGYQLAFTPGLLAQVYQREGQPLIVHPADVLGGPGADQGGYVDLDTDNHWWIPSGQMFFSPDSGVSPGAELALAQENFFVPRRYQDPFGHRVIVNLDGPVDPNKLRYNLLMTLSMDALGNTVRAVNDYRVLQVSQMTDINGNRTQVAFDALGMVVGTAVMGKETGPVEGDTLAGFTTDLTSAQIRSYFDSPDPRLLASDLLGTATARTLYDLDHVPASAASIVRETHVSELRGAVSKVQLSFSYSDGFGREVQKKIQAESGPVPQRDASGNIKIGPDEQPILTANDVDPRWVGSGWTVFNNKGKPVRRFEPFFSDTHQPDHDLRIGVSPWLFYDPVGRVVVTLHPNHTFEKVIFDSWRQEIWDVNDTLLLDPEIDPEVSGYFTRLDSGEYLPSWHALRTDPVHTASFTSLYPDTVLRGWETVAAKQTEVHVATPSVAHADALGRTFLTIAHNKALFSDGRSTEEFPATRVELDIEGNQLSVTDALNRVVMRYDHDLLGHRIHQSSMEAGQRWMLHDVGDKPIRAWDEREHTFRTEYDWLRRPTRSYVIGANTHSEAEPEILTDLTIYGEQHPQATNRNLRGKPYLHFDQSGTVSTERHDFKGNPLSTTRQLAREYKRAIDWSAVKVAVPDAQTPLDLNILNNAIAPQLEEEIFTASTTYDALNRPITVVTPHSSNGVPSRIVPTFNAANLLERLEVNLNGAADSTTFVTNIDYNAKGQRERIEYGNGVTTTYRYDPLTLRLTLLLTRRDRNAFPDDCPQPPKQDWPGCQIQNLHYTFDPVGNITYIRDFAQQIIFFNNRRVEPSNQYTYDSTYRLIEATGREHLGQARNSNTSQPYSWDDVPRVNQPHPSDGNAMGNYMERYLYDLAGNFEEMQHHLFGSDVSLGWTRTYEYHEPSLLDSVQVSNRLSRTSLGGASNERYIHDSHGNMTSMPHLSRMEWDYRDQICATSKTNGNGEVTYYVYDSYGERIRKISERTDTFGNSSLVLDNIYLGNYEICRSYINSQIKVEEELLSISDGKNRIAIAVSSNSQDNISKIARYQLSNQIGSVDMELSEAADVLLYQEYSPYGSTTMLSNLVKSFFSFLSLEKDEESGFICCSFRYYAPFLGLFNSCDPLYFKIFYSQYNYCRCNPINFVDKDGLKPKVIDSRSFTGKESEGELHAIARSKGYDFTGTPVWDGKNWNLGDIHKIKKQSIRQSQKPANGGSSGSGSGGSGSGGSGSGGSGSGGSGSGGSGSGGSGSGGSGSGGSGSGIFKGFFKGLLKGLVIGIAAGVFVGLMIASGGTLALIGSGLAVAGAGMAGVTAGQIITGETITGEKLSGEQRAEMGGELLGGLAGGIIAGGIVRPTGGTVGESVPINEGTPIVNDVIGKPRVNNGLKNDVVRPRSIPDVENYGRPGVREFGPEVKGHGFPDVIDNYAGDAVKTDIGRGAELYQLEGNLNGTEGRFEWITQDGNVTHRQFIPGGKVNGRPIKK